MAREEERLYIINVNDAEESRTPHGKLVKWLLSKEIGAPNFEMRYFELDRRSKGKEEAHPFEHEIYVLKGEGVIMSGGVPHRIKPGDAILILPNEPHQFLNLREEPLAFICVIPKGCEDHIKRRGKVCSRTPHRQSD